MKNFIEYLKKKIKSFDNYYSYYCAEILFRYIQTNDCTKEDLKNIIINQIKVNDRKHSLEFKKLLFALEKIYE